MQQEVAEVVGRLTPVLDKLELTCAYCGAGGVTSSISRSSGGCLKAHAGS